MTKRELAMKIAAMTEKFRRLIPMHYYLGLAFFFPLAITPIPSMGFSGLMSEMQECVQYERSHWEKLANTGDAHAQYCLGMALQSPDAAIGLSEEQKTEWQAKRMKERQTGIDWIRRSAEQGYAPAQAELGNAYTFGFQSYIDKDFEKAMFWLEKAANQGSAFANASLAEFYRGQIGDLPIDKQRSYGHLRLAIELFRTQSDPAEFQSMMQWLNLRTYAKELGQELAEEDRSKAESWVESQLNKFTKP